MINAAVLGGTGYVGPKCHKGFDGLAAVVVHDGKVVPLSDLKKVRD